MITLRNGIISIEGKGEISASRQGISFLKEKGECEKTGQSCTRVRFVWVRLAEHKRNISVSQSIRIDTNTTRNTTSRQMMPLQLVAPKNQKVQDSEGTRQILKSRNMKYFFETKTSQLPKKSKCILFEIKHF